MKIVPPHPSPGIAPESKGIDKTLPEGGPSFGDVLDQAVDRRPAAVSPPPKAMGIGRPPVVTNDAEARLQAVAAEVESSLSALEAYRDALADPHTNLRAVAPLLTALEAAGRRLDETLTDLPADAPLRQVGAQTSALIATEKGRFESGAYN